MRLTLHIFYKNRNTIQCMHLRQPFFVNFSLFCDALYSFLSFSSFLSSLLCNKKSDCLHFICNSAIMNLFMALIFPHQLVAFFLFSNLFCKLRFEGCCLVISEIILYTAIYTPVVLWYLYL
jgi:hypothetical protein